MTSKELRKQRRREEHDARKEANRKDQLPSLVGNVKLDAPQQSENAIGEPRVPSPTPTGHTERNRKNAQFSTGPKTPEGKAQAGKNAVRHGLASNLFLILPWENGDDFDLLLSNLRTEHRPATQTEALLVEKMAQHFWLSQRSLRLQELCFHRDAPLCDQPKDLALYLRYGTTHDRAFHKCLAELSKLRATQQKEIAGFASQERRQAAETRKGELHEARVAVLTSKKYAQKSVRGHKESPIPVSAISASLQQPGELPLAHLKFAKTSPQLSSQAM